MGEKNLENLETVKKKIGRHPVIGLGNSVTDKRSLPSCAFVQTIFHKNNAKRKKRSQFLMPDLDKLVGLYILLCYAILDFLGDGLFGFLEESF